MSLHIKPILFSGVLARGQCNTEVLKTGIWCQACPCHRPTTDDNRRRVWEGRETQLHLHWPQECHPTESDRSLPKLPLPAVFLVIILSTANEASIFAARSLMPSNLHAFPGGRLGFRFLFRQLRDWREGHPEGWGPEGSNACQSYQTRTQSLLRLWTRWGCLHTYGHMWPHGTTVLSASISWSWWQVLAICCGLNASPQFMYWKLNPWCNSVEQGDL